MSFLSNSSTKIELILKNALEKEKITYEEQYLIYTGGKFSTAKYCADFYININNIKLLIECDGFTYHNGNKKLFKDYQRDLWLKNHNYTVLHFSTSDIKYELQYVIETIKFVLKISDKKPKKRTTYSNNSYSSQKEYIEVTLFLAYYLTYNKLFITYKFVDNRKAIYSEERQKICLNVPDYMTEATAISLALSDIKKDVSIEVEYCGKPFNKKNTIKKQLLAFKNTKNLCKRLYLKSTNILNHSTKNLTIYKPKSTIDTLRKHCLSMAKFENKEIITIDYKDLI